jgi:SAM-dependent methyltransferase
MAEHDWNAHYASGELPWDSGEADPQLVELVLQRQVAAGRALEIGCGTGTNALWLATQGFDVQAIDLAPLAIERARSKNAAAKLAQGKLEFEQRDFLNGAEFPPASFQFVFDRGCFHVFDDASDQAKFAARVSKLLAPGGLWLSLIGSTEGPAREFGPPRRSARDLVSAIEPALEIVHLRAITFTGLPNEVAPKAWNCLSRRRDVPAQPPSRFT